MLFSLELFAAAFVASIFGSMVGLGGGFILVPIMRLFMGFPPAYAAGTSLVLIVANSASGAFAYLLQRRVHLKIGLLVAAGGLPGSVLGAIASLHISPLLFDSILAALLVAVAIDMAWNAERRMAGRVEHHRVASIKGMSYRGALALGFIVGIFSSLFGLGGGIVVVPALLYFSELPVHAISATSQFAILLTSPVGLAVHASAARRRGSGHSAASRRRSAGRPDRRAHLVAFAFAATPHRRRDRASDRSDIANLASVVENALR